MVKSPSHLEYLLGYSFEKIRKIATDPVPFYYEFVKVTKKEGKVKQRTINPSQGALRNIQNKINDRIILKINLPGYVQGGVKGKDGISNAKQHVGFNNHFSTDIKISSLMFPAEWFIRCLWVMAFPQI